MDKQDVPHDLHTFMAQVTDELSSEYARIYSNAASDPGTAGDEGEENWANLFRDWLPPYYHVSTKGRIIAVDGTLSPQVDVLVLKPTYPRKLLTKKMWMAGGVAAAFECKTTLTAEHVADATNRAKAIKALYKPRTGTPWRELQSPIVYGLLAHSHCWKGQKSTPVENIDRALKTAMAELAHPSEEIDLICVADLATWKRSYLTRYEASWKPDAQNILEAIFGGRCGPQTSMICAAIDREGQGTEFRPVGNLVANLTELLAWSDPAVRDIADYYRLAKLLGSGHGSTRPWPLTVYSEGVRAEIVGGRFTNGVPWDEWIIGN